jgi:hypothetical protein
MDRDKGYNNGKGKVKPVEVAVCDAVSATPS